MTARHERQLRALCDALAIETAQRVRWLGQIQETGGELEDALADLLYRDFYCPGSPKRRPEPHERPLAVRAPFIEALSEANVGEGMWAQGWTRLGADEHGVRVEQAGLELRAPPERVRAQDGGVAVRYPKEFVAVSPGYYTAVGNGSHPGRRTRARIYFDVPAEGAPALMRAVTRHLNAIGVPFRLKVLNDPQHYDRCDAGVLYLSATGFQATVGALKKVAGELRAWLVEGVPALTKPLAVGIAAAEDPPGSESFGTHRCRLIAQALVRAHTLGLTTFEGRLTVIAATFADGGRDLQMPYLEPGGQDVYQL